MRGIPKVGVLLLVLVIALALVGVGFAHWSKPLHITGTVNTGDLDACWSAGLSSDTEPPDKDFSSIRCWVDEVDCQILYVVVDNAYPCIDYYQEVDIHNTGTIPLHIDGIDMTAVPPWCTVEITDLSCNQLHPGESAWGRIHVHLFQEAPEGTTIKFECSLMTTQWNAPVGP